MRNQDVFLLIAITLMMSIGQVLLKITAGFFPVGARLDPLALINRYFIGALLVYGIAAILWIFALREMALSRAYPFIVLSFLFTPLLAWEFLGEPLSWSYAFGMGLICAGLLVVTHT
ncbi:MAG: EamA family transporter [Rhodospirillaceae bacterium]